MHHRFTTRAIAAGLVGVVGSIAGFGGVAAADPADDVAVMVDNLPAAVDVLVAGLQEAVDVASTTQSATQTSHAVGNALVQFGSELVVGTEQFGALGLGFALLNGSLQSVLDPYTNAIDDPSTAGDLVNPDDLSTLLANLPSAVDGLLHGDAALFPTEPNGLACAVAEALRGNLIGGPGFQALDRALLGCGVIGTATGVMLLTQGTNYTTVQNPVLIGALILALAGADYVQQVEDALAPAFDAANPALEQVAVVIEGL